MSFLDDWKEWSTTKKAISILVVCCIGLIIIGALTGGGSPDKNTQSTASSNSDNDSTAEQAQGLQVKIIYSGKWSGALGEAGSSNSISGTGNETIDMDDDVSIVSATAQKQDGSSEELVVQIIKDGKVIKEGSTNTEYGVVSISSMV